MNPQLRLADRNDVDDLQQYFAEHRRVQIPDVLNNQTAEAIYQALNTQEQWNIVWNDNGQHVDMDYEGVMQLPKAQLTELQKKVLSQAAHEFQYLYANIPCLIFTTTNCYLGISLTAFTNLLTAKRCSIWHDP